MRSLVAMLMLVAVPATTKIEVKRAEESPTTTTAGTRTLSFSTVHKAVVALNSTSVPCNRCQFCWSMVYWKLIPGGVEVIGAPDESCTNYCIGTYCSDSEEDVTDPSTQVGAVEVLKVAASIADPQPLSIFLAAGAKVRYNVKRQSVQLIGCNGIDVVANIPVAENLRSLALRTARDSHKVVGEE